MSTCFQENPITIVQKVLKGCQCSLQSTIAETNLVWAKRKALPMTTPRNLQKGTAGTGLPAAWDQDEEEARTDQPAIAPPDETVHPPTLSRHRRRTSHSL